MLGPERSAPFLAPVIGQTVSSGLELQNATQKKGLPGTLLSLGFAPGQWSRAFEGSESAGVIWVIGGLRVWALVTVMGVGMVFSNLLAV